MLRLMSRKDRTTKQRANVLDKEARFPNGSYCIRVNASGEDAAVSGGFTFFTERLRARLGLDVTLANVLETRDGRLTGQVLGDIVDADAKARKVREVCETSGCVPTPSIVLGDGATDLKMMAISGLSVAFRAKPVVQQQARVALNHTGLDGVLSLFDPRPGE
jgi:phosphoserine phosphatase